MHKVIASYFWGNSVVLFIFVTCLISLWLRRKNLEGKVTCLLQYTLIFIATVLWNPVLYKIMLASFFSDAAEVVRIYLIFPVWWIIALAIVDLLKGYEVKKQIIGLIGVLIFIVLIGNNTLSSDLFEKKTNWYKINDDAVQIADIILEEEDGRNTVALIQDQGTKYTAGGGIWEGVRQYTSKIRPVSFDVDRNNLVVEQPEVTEVYIKQLVEAAQNMIRDDDVEAIYIVIQRETEGASYFILQNGQLVGETKDLLIYRYKI